MLLYVIDEDGAGRTVAVQHVPEGERTTPRRAASGPGRRRYYRRATPPAWRLTGTPANLIALGEAVKLGAEELSASRLGLGTGPVVL